MQNITSSCLLCFIQASCLSQGLDRSLLVIFTRTAAAAALCCWLDPMVWLKWGQRDRSGGWQIKHIDWFGSRGERESEGLSLSLSASVIPPPSSALSDLSLLHDASLWCGPRHSRHVPTHRVRGDLPAFFRFPRRHLKHFKRSDRLFPVFCRDLLHPMVSVFVFFLLVETESRGFGHFLFVCLFLKSNKH